MIENILQVFLGLVVLQMPYENTFICQILVPCHKYCIVNLRKIFFNGKWSLETFSNGDT